ncbi:MAG: hypothetical protein QF464_11845 [Myxococcota bacterium]|jgi:hypothetical protein|nr:hypothetical protein [Myxococcota bacterium]
MIKLDQNARPAALAKFAQHGGYVPRFFFLKPDGSLNEALTSGHPRFPYFFSSQNIGRLKAIMQTATAGS